MSAYQVCSDQFYNWSAKGARCDRSKQKIDECVEAQADAAVEGSSAVGRHSSWLTNRAIQTLRQVRMSVCTRPRTWSEVLSVDHTSEVTATDGIRSGELPPAGHGSVGELQALARRAGGGLCNQHRTASSQRKAVVASADGHRRGHSDGGNLCREHASAVVARAEVARGGIRE